MKNLINLTAALILLLFVALSCKDSADKPKTTIQTANAPVAAESPESKPNVTMATFSQLKNGMRYEDAVKILGAEGEVLSESEIAGTKTVMYQWNGEGFGANMNAMFQNGKLVSKAQFGLK